MSTTMSASAREAARCQLAAIAGKEPETSFIEIRPLDPPGRQWWIPVREIGGAIDIVSAIAAHRNVYVGAAPRVRHSGKADAVERVWCLWADCDSVDAVESLKQFKPLPAIVVKSGTGKNVHGWWPLREPLTRDQAVRANRRLARVLGADRAATDAARVMRPVGSLNHKHNPPVPVQCVHLELDTFVVGDIVRGLADDDCYTPKARPVRLAVDHADAALAGLARVVRESPEGERNHRLNWAAWRAGEHIAAGKLTESEVHGALCAAAVDVGLPEHEALRTIASGLGAGMREAA